METPQTGLEYHTDEDSHGNYIFISLDEILNEMLLETTDPDSYLVNTPRSKLVANLKKGIRSLNRDIKKTVLAREFTVGPSLNWVLPQDYVDWIRVSVLDEDCNLQPLNVNTNVHKAEAYLQDNDYVIQFNNEGEILTLDAANTYAKPFTKYEFCSNYRGRNFGFSSGYRGGHFELDTSKLSKYGEFSIDEQVGRIVFSSNLQDRDIVLEYISDGLEMENLRLEEITFHKDLRETLYAYVYNECISRRRNVPRNEKDRAKAEYKALRHQAVVIAANFDLNEIMRLQGSKSKQI